MIWSGVAIFLSVLGAIVQLVLNRRLNRGWRRWPIRAEKAQKDVEVDVLMCVRNGVAEIEDWMSSMGAQVDVHLRIVVVDDGSTDGTSARLESLSVPNPHTLQVIHVQGTRPGKKDALQIGMESAKGPWVWMTDVDCRPRSRETCSRLVHAMALDHADVILGVSLPLRGSVKALPLWDGLRVAQSYLGWAGEGLPYMAVGRNWMVRKSLWPKISVHSDLASGDDDLTFQAIHSHQPNLRVQGVIDPMTQMDTWTPNSMKAFGRAKRRHLSTGQRYSRKMLWILALPTGVGICFLGAFMALAVACWTETEVLHTALWIAFGWGGASWCIHAINFRSFMRACGIQSGWQWLGWLQPVFWFWLVGQTLRALLMNQQEEWGERKRS